MMRGLCLLALLLLAAGVRASSPAVESLANGLRLVVLPTTSSQVVTVEALIDFSALDEPAAYQGVRQVLLMSMLQGSSVADGGVIRHYLTSVGGELEGRLHQNMLAFRLTLPAHSLGPGLAALAEVLCRPRLTDEGIRDAIERTRRQQQIAPVGALDTASHAAYTALYAHHPYGTRGLGYPSTLSRLTPDFVRLAYRTCVVPGTVVISVVGRCTLDDARAKVAAAFGAWTGPTLTARPPFPAPELATSELLLREEPVNSTCVLLMFPVCGVEHEDFPTLQLIDALLSGGTGSRLFRSVREKLGFAYEVASHLAPQASSSYFTAYALIQQNALEQTKAALVAELARLQTETISPEELERAKAYLTGRYLLSHQYSARHAFDLAWYELLGLGTGYDAAYPARIHALTAQDVQRVARAYFTRYYLAVVIPRTIGDADAGASGLGRRSAGVHQQ